MNAYAAYSRVQNATEDPRSIEYRLLGQVTSALMAADANPQDHVARVDALLWNRQVWSVFRVDLAAADNRMPLDLRAKLISLSLWVNRETSLAMRSRKPDLKGLIGLNRTVMKGLHPAAIG